MTALKCIILIAALYTNWISPQGDMLAHMSVCRKNLQAQTERTVATCSELILTASIVDQVHCKGSIQDTENINLTLNLRFNNKSDKPVILYKRANMITSYYIASNEGNMSNKKYESRFSFHLTHLGQRYEIISEVPPSEEFEVIQPNASFERRAFLTISAATSKQANYFDYLSPGNHVLQISVNVWPPFAKNRPIELQEKWRPIGVFCTEVVTSEPIPLQINEKRVIKDCPLKHQ